MNYSFYISGLFLGFLGSLHCVGMCGPIATLASGKSRGWRFWQSQGLYHLGKTFTYALLGAVFGFLGEVMVFATSQQYLSIGMGILMLGMAFYPGLSKLEGRYNPFRFIQKPMKKALGQLQRKPQQLVSLTLGFINGFLPCGLVYAGLAGAVAMGTLKDGAFFMSAFGIGTFPALALAAGSLGMAKSLGRFNVNKWRPVLLFVMAILFILRGMNLGIPFLSPQIAGHSITLCF